MVLPAETGRGLNVNQSITLDGILRERINCGLVVVDSGGELTLLNIAATELLTYGSPPPSRLESLPEPLQTLARLALEKQRPVALEEMDLQFGDHPRRTLGVEITLLPQETDTHSLLIQLQGTQPDNPFEAKIRHVERLARLGMLSAGLAHELRNTMVALSTMTDLLLEQQPDNDLARTARRELDRANTLAVQMLKYARPQPHLMKAVSTHAVLDQALQLAQPRFKAVGATVTQSFEASPDTILADEALMEQLFLNLLLNAADAIPEHGDVHLSTQIVQTGADKVVQITVADNGAGIAPEDVPKLFEPFFTTRRHGTGLGLYLSQRIAQDHSGSISIDSTPGKGTRVQVSLPIQVV